MKGLFVCGVLVHIQFFLKKLFNMANPEHVEIIRQGVEKWNEWRKNNPLISPDLSHANLENANLIGVDFDGYWNRTLDGSESYCYLHNANLSKADLSNAKMRGALLIGTNLKGANLCNADLSRFWPDRDISEDTDLTDSILDYANLSGAKLNYANLTRANLVGTNFSGATINGCKIYGISAWDVNLENAVQKNLVISKGDEPEMSVDNLHVAQFIYLMINNKNIRDVLDTITAKGVLILGRFTEKRKEVLDGLKEELRKFGLLPIMFDFDRPTNKDYTETVQTLAGMCMFVIADVTAQKSAPLELEATIKQFKIPYQPIFDSTGDNPYPFPMLQDLQNSFHWVLKTLSYKGKDQLLNKEIIRKYIIDPVNKKREELKNDKSVKQEMTIITEIV